MDLSNRCQSCGMPLGLFDVHGKKEHNFGSNKDNSKNHEYCKFCFQRGAFTKPDLTVQGMVDLSVEFMTKNLKFSKEEAQRISNEVIPKLKRWNTRA